MQNVLRCCLIKFLFSIAPEIPVTGGEANPDSVRGGADGAIAQETSGRDPVGAQGGAQGPSGGNSTRDGQFAGQKDDGNNSAKDDNENKEGGQRRSIISSIRLV